MAEMFEFTTKEIVPETIKTEMYKDLKTFNEELPKAIERKIPKFRFMKKLEKFKIPMPNIIFHAQSLVPKILELVFIDETKTIRIFVDMVTDFPLAKKAMRHQLKKALKDYVELS